MLLSRRSTVLVSVVTTISVLAVSCSESKTSQCNKLIGVANNVVTEVQGVTKNAQGPQDTEAMKKIASTTAQAKTKMETLKVSDEQLQNYQSRFIAMYSDTSEATGKMVTAIGEQNAEAAQQAFDALQDATEREAPLVNEVNSYCNN